MNTTQKNEQTTIYKSHFWNYNTGPAAPYETQNYTLVQVAESYYRNNFSIPEHKQCCDIEITHALTNGLFCAADDVEEPVDKQHFYLSLRNDNHRLYSRCSCRFQTLAIDVKDGPCLPLLREIQKKYHTKRCGHLPDIAALLTSVVAEYLFSPSEFSALSLDSLITTILLHLIRLDSPSAGSKLLSTEETVLSMINYIDLHFLEICSLDELSPRLGYTYGHLCKLFKKQAGITPNEYLLSRKMEYAARLLTDGMSMAQIAELLGYSTPYNFSRAFKKQYGIAPKLYKRNAVTLSSP